MGVGGLGENINDLWTSVEEFSLNTNVSLYTNVVSGPVIESALLTKKKCFL